MRGIGEQFRRYAHALRFTIRLHIVPRNSTQLLIINTAKFQVERDRASLMHAPSLCH